MFHLALLFVLLLLENGVSVAPGDEEPLCEELRAKGAAPIPAYSANMRVLMDSWNYQNLLPVRTRAVWDQVDNDKNNPNGLTTNWIQNSNTPCGQFVHACGYSGGPQSNWLITQLVNRTVNGTNSTKLTQVSVLIEFELQDCDTTLDCQRTFNTHMFETSEIATGARDINNYRQVKRVSPDVTTGERVNKTIDLSFDTDHSSFYFAVQDETSCMVITRLIMFYHICPARITNLVIYPETIAPPISRQSLPLLITAKCVDNASPIVAGNSSGPKIKCIEGGTWFSIPELGCKCDHGYLPSMDRQRCEGCSDGQYYSEFTNTCLDCPHNSNSSSNGTTSLECVCEYGYYWNNQNESCVAAVLKEEVASSSNLPIILPVLLLTIILIGFVIITVFLYLRERHKRMNRVYRVAQSHNGQPIALQEEPANGVQLHPPLLPQRQISTASTRSYVSARSSTTFKWNIAYFLFKILGSPGDTQSPAAPPEQPSDQTPATMFESRDHVERYDTDDQGPAVRVHVDAVTDYNGLDPPHYVNVDYELFESRDQGVQGDGNEKPTADFSDEGYLRVLS